MFEGRFKTLKPKDLEKSAIFGWSVETITSCLTLDLFIALNVYSNNGLPDKSTIFFNGILLDPPLAGITIRTLIFYSTLLILFNTSEIVIISTKKKSLSIIGITVNPYVFISIRAWS